eukprot:TRINITY_DN1641_c0_g1_i1.p1 TRINITY_DN1641_c0_g1~~TRINITY_DN1641_c0_g1_i1.p1  ORF type:complete len:150 (+),score=53.20 TRINITY_DN1641_c0_g1_i1:63-512(+)
MCIRDRIKNHFHSSIKKKFFFDNEMLLSKYPNVIQLILNQPYGLSEKQIQFYKDKFNSCDQASLKNNMIISKQKKSKSKQQKKFEESKSEDSKEISQMPKDNVAKISEIPTQYIDQNSNQVNNIDNNICLLYTSPSPRDKRQSRMPSSA